MPEYILKRDGSVVRRPLEMTVEGEQPLHIDDAILSQIKIKQSVKIPALGFLDDSVVSLCSTDASSFFVSMPLRTLKLNCTVRAVGTYVIPSFEERGDFVTLNWTVPHDMLLVFCAHVSGAAGGFSCEYCYLFALDGDKRAFVLPLPNIYNDAHLCTGAGYYTGYTILKCFEQTFIGVRDSRWNNHLIHDNDGVFENSQKLFRFRPLKDGYETVSADTHWTKLSRSVGTDILQYLCL